MSVTDADLRYYVHRGGFDSERLDGVHELDHEWRLGLLYVHKTEPYYRFGYAYDVSATSGSSRGRSTSPTSAGAASSSSSGSSTGRPDGRT